MRADVLSPELVKAFCCAIECCNDHIAQKFGRHLGSCSACQFLKLCLFFCRIIECCNGSLTYPLSTAYMLQYFWSALVEIMACRLFGQAIISTKAALLSIGPLWVNFNEILIKIQNFSFMKMNLKISSAKMAAILYRGRYVNDKGRWINKKNTHPSKQISNNLCLLG